ncbi:MAG: TolC family protein [Croceibacterium sp.]
MKKHLCGTALASAFMAAIIAPAAWAETLTLGDAVSIALDRSPELGRAQSQTHAAEAVRDAVRREWLPKVSLDAAGGVRHLQNDARIDAGLSAIDEKPLHASVTVDQPLWDFGRRDEEIRSRQQSLVAAQQDEAGAAEQIAFSISRAYLETYAGEHVLAASQENLAFHEKLADDVRLGVTQGVMSISEQQQASERLQTARVRLTEAANNLVIAREKLAQMLGRDDITVAAPEVPGAKLPANVDEATDRAAAVDPAIQGALARYRAARYGTGRAEAERWPTVGLQGAYRYGQDFEGYRGLTKDAQALVSLRWNLFDGGVTAAKIREASSREDDAGFALEAARRDSELQARVSWQQMQAARRRVTEQEERAAVAAQVRESYTAQFGIGRRSLLDLLDAQAAVYNAQVEAETTRSTALLWQYALLAQLRELTTFLGVEPAPVDPATYRRD